MRKLLTIFSIFLITSISLVAQNIILEGYVYESNNRGYLNQVKVTILDYANGFVKGETYTDENGRFEASVAGGIEYQIKVEKSGFIDADLRLKTTQNEKAFAKIQMDRKPGYIFDMTFAKAREANEITDGLTGIKIEVFNNTTNKALISIDSTDSQNFQFTMEQGNHYTILVRKWGFFTKRIEAYVNVKGCILCIDGVDKVTPGVSDNLTQGFQMGTLLANIELQPLELGKTIQIKNIYYDLGSAALRPEAKKELDKLSKALKDNPFINIELSSHTDARGDANANLQLSQRRADAVVEYLVRVGKIDGRKLTAQGYGENKLTNRCNDANIPNCSEAEHQQNRRTELKITAIKKEDFLAKSLAEIIREEQMEVTLQKIQTEEKQQYTSGDEDMPEDLKKYIESQKANSTNATTTNSNTNKTIEVAPKNEVKKDTKILKEQKINHQAAKRNFDIPADYNGYRIEIFKTEKALANTHEIFSRFDIIGIETNKKGWHYLVGDFKSSADADVFYKQTVSKWYPKAKIINYVNGVRQ